MAECVTKEYKGRIKRNGGIIRVETTETRDKYGSFADMRTTIYANGRFFYSAGKDITKESKRYAKSEHGRVVRVFKTARGLDEMMKRLGEIF